MANPEKTVKLYKVYDSSATAVYPTRTHEIVMGGIVKQIKFTYGEPTLLPFEEAAKFQKAEGFIVKTDEDVVMQKPVIVPPAVMNTLKPNECVARMEELTKDALYLRCVMLPNGDSSISKATSKDELIEFLANYNKSLIKPDLAPNLDASGKPIALETEDMNDEESLALFGKEAA